MSEVVVKHMDPVHTDERGSITDIFNTDNDPAYHIGVITFEPGVVRANHYHKECNQYDYIQEGTLELATKPADDPDAEVSIVTMNAGDTCFIPAGTIHAYKAVTPAVMIDITTSTRAGNAYEDDVYRVDPIIS